MAGALSILRRLKRTRARVATLKPLPLRRWMAAISENRVCGLSVLVFGLARLSWALWPTKCFASKLIPYPPCGMKRLRMNDQTAFYGTAGVTALNLVVGIINMDTLNLAVAGLGVCSMLLANAYKIAIAFIKLRDLHRKGWKLPKQEKTADE